MEGRYYKSIEEFIGEYCGIENEVYRRFWGLEFIYHGKMYRMTVDQIESDEERREFEKILNRKLGQYEVALIDNNITTELSSDEYHFLGWYDDIFDLLENCYIDGVQFRDIMTDPELFCDSQD